MTKMTDEKWINRGCYLASVVAGWSKDPSKQVGAVIIPDDFRSVSWGYNGFPSGVPDDPEALGNKELKNTLVIHAELNAILNARGDVSGRTMFVTAPPCAECAKAISSSGIAHVVHPYLRSQSSWYTSHVLAQELFKKAGVRTTATTFPDVWELLCSPTVYGILAAQGLIMPVDARVSGAIDYLETALHKVNDYQDPGPDMLKAFEKLKSLQRDWRQKPIQIPKEE